MARRSQAMIALIGSSCSSAHFKPACLERRFGEQHRFISAQQTEGRQSTQPIGVVVRTWRREGTTLAP
jgi:hypothetical protein